MQSTGRSALLYRLTPYFFIALPLAIYLVWVVGPMLYTFYLSLTDWDGISQINFIAFRNYRALFRDRVPPAPHFPPGRQHSFLRHKAVMEAAGIAAIDAPNRLRQRLFVARAKFAAKAGGNIPQHHITQTRMPLHEAL